MRYHYFYQSRENKTLDDWIEAKNRDDAYAQLRKRGIKPFKVLGRNPYAWKRWTAIGVLAAVAAVLAAVVVREVIRDKKQEHDTAFAAEDRAQIYGDSATLQQLAADGWRKAMGNAGDAWLARHAIPGVLCDCAKDAASARPATDPMRILPEDPPEIAKMKRIVNGMKRELAEYLAADGSVEDYMSLCDERLHTESDILKNVRLELRALHSRMTAENYDETAAAWAKKNATLRSFGLPTVVMPDDPRESTSR